MEFQGKKATHDFLSLYNRDSSFQLQEDSRPASSQGFFLKTHDFLKPLEKTGETEPARRVGPTDRAATVAHVLPGGMGTYSISRVSENGSGVLVKPEIVTCARGYGLAGKPEPDSGNGGHGPYAGMAFTIGDASSAAATDNVSRGKTNKNMSLTLELTQMVRSLNFMRKFMV